MLFRRHAPVNPKTNCIFFLKKEMLVFICLFCIHFQLMLPGNMLETKCLCLTVVELGRDSDVLNALRFETFPLHCNWTCLPAFITTDIHVGALPFLFISCL